MRSEDVRIARQVGDALRRLRERSERRQYRVAAEAGISSTMLSQYELGWHCPSLPTLIRLLAALDCSADDFGRMLGPWGSLRA